MGEYYVKLLDRLDQLNREKASGLLKKISVSIKPMLVPMQTISNIYNK